MRRPRGSASNTACGARTSPIRRHARHRRSRSAKRGGASPTGRWTGGSRAGGARRIERGELYVRIACGAEAPLNFGTLKAWEALKTLAIEDKDDPAASCKP